MADRRSHDDGGITRRRFVRDAGIATVAAADFLGAAALAASPNRRRRKRPTVAVFGGGIAGLTAAQELAERGFDVAVYERRAWGGRARSTEVPGSASGGRRPLPGEHSFRAFLGFYQNTTDTMRRIPFGSNPHGVLDNLVAVPQLVLARDGRRRDIATPLGSLDPRPYTPEQVLDVLVGVLAQTDLPPDAVTHFATRMVVFLSSCDARRIGQWEHTTWADFTAADRYSDDYRKIIVKTFADQVVASKAERVSTFFCAQLLEWLVYAVLGRGAAGPAARMLNLPTNEALIDPWLGVLHGLGVRLHNHRALVGFDVGDGRIAGARVHGPRRAATVHADWYVCALPLERARRILSPALVAADPALARMRSLETAWSNGLKFFLREQTPLFRGVVDYIDSPWLVTSVSQAQFWPVDFASTYGDSRVRESLSATIAAFDTPGIVYGKSARQCKPVELVREVWEQMKATSTTLVGQG